MPRRKEVDDWFARYDNPMKPVVMRAREIILAADARIDECIKWKAPTFTFEGNLASFFPTAKRHASLMFHTGASIPGKHPRLEGGGGTSKMLKIPSLEEAERAKPELEAIVRAWCDWKSSPNAVKPAAKKRASTKKAKTPTKRSKPAAKQATAKKPTRVAKKSETRKTSTAKKATKKTTKAAKKG